jgi:Ca-activated chloride channel family protein
MSWGHGAWLWLLVAIAAAAAGGAWWRWSAHRRLAQLGVPLQVGRRREYLRLVLLWLGLSAGVVALAGPRWGSVTETRTATGTDIVLALDCSRSMQATDLYPTRMEAARRKAQDLLRLAPGTRLALMPFAALPVLRCPLTGDHQALAEMLQDCSPDLFPAESGYQGTAIGSAVAEALKVLGGQGERGQAILIMSDGADDDQQAVSKAADSARAAGVPVVGIFIGDPDKQVSVPIDGQDQIMTADRSTLEQLATATEGLCVNAVLDDRDMQTVADFLAAHTAQRPWEERRRMVASERFQWLLVPAIVLLALGALLPTRRRRPLGGGL